MQLHQEQEEKNSKRKIPSISFYLPLKIQVLYKNPMIHGTLMIKKSVLEELNFIIRNLNIRKISNY